MNALLKIIINEIFWCGWAAAVVPEALQGAGYTFHTFPHLAAARA